MCHPALLYPVSFSYENVSINTQKEIRRYVSSTQPPDEWCCVLVSLFLCLELASWHSIFRYSVLNLLVLYWSAEVVATSPAYLLICIDVEFLCLSFKGIPSLPGNSLPRVMITMRKHNLWLHSIHLALLLSDLYIHVIWGRCNIKNNCMSEWRHYY